MNAFIYYLCIFAPPFLAVGYLIGSRRRTIPEEKDKSTCSCTHKYSMHLESGACNAAVTRDRYNKQGDFTGKDYLPCACVRYDGIPPAHLFMKDL